MATKILHLDAALGVTVDGSNYVSQWNDQSGNNYHVVQGTQANKPLLVASALNGKPVIRFDGSNDYLNKSFGASYTQPLTMFIVAKNTASTGYHTFIDGYASSPRFYYAVGITSAYAYMYNGGNMISTTILSTSNFTLSTCKYNGASSLLRINAANDITGNPGTAGLNGVTIGCNYNKAEPLAGDIAEIIIYSSITDTEIIDVEKYLSGKYALGLNENVDFITLEEEQLYSPRLDEASVDFVTLEEEQLPLSIPEQLTEAIVIEQDLDVTPLEVIVGEYVSDELYPISVTVVEDDINRFKEVYPCNKTVSMSNQSSNKKLWIDRGFVFVRTNTIIS